MIRAQQILFEIVSVTKTTIRTQFKNNSAVSHLLKDDRDDVLVIKSQKYNATTGTVQYYPLKEQKFKNNNNTTTIQSSKINRVKK